MTRAFFLVIASLTLGCGNGFQFAQSSSGRFDAKMNAGSMALDAKDFETAKREYTAALEAAGASNDPVMTAKALQALAFASLSFGRPADALTHAETGLAQLGKATEPQNFLKAALLLQFGKAQQIRGDYKGAVASLDEAEKLFKEEKDALVERYEAAFALGITHGTYGRYDDAIKCFERALEAERARIKLGEDSPLVAAAYCEIGRCHMDANRFDKSAEFLELATKVHRSRRLLDNSMSRDTSLEEAWVAVNTARLIELRSMAIKTDAMFAEAAKNFENNAPQPSPQLIFIHREQGRALLAHGKSADAEVALKKSLLACHEYYGKNHPELAKTLTVYSALLDATNRSDEAQRMRGTAQEILSTVAQVDTNKATASTH
jgi:tetratricopeptide (TPR) repeat protein